MKTEVTGRVDEGTSICLRSRVGFCYDHRQGFLGGWSYGVWERHGPIRIIMNLDQHSGQRT